MYLRLTLFYCWILNLDQIQGKKVTPTFLLACATIMNLNVRLKIMALKY